MQIPVSIEPIARNGAEIVPLEMTPQPHPLAEFVGMFKDDPYFKEVVEIVAANRRKMDRIPRKS